MKRIILILVFIVMFQADYFECLALTKIGIVPDVVDLSLGKGTTRAFHIAITNYSDNASFDFKIYILDMDIKTGGSVQYVPPGSGIRSCSKWLDIQNKEIRVAPGETEKIIYKLALPANLPAGGYYSAIMCEIVNKINPSNSKYDVVTRFAIPVITTVYGGRIEKKISLEELSVNTTLDKIQAKEDNEAEQENGGGDFEGLYFKAIIKNEGNIHLKARGKFTIFTKELRRVEELSVDEALVFPEHLRDFTVTYKKLLIEGDYIVRAAFRCEGQKPLVKEIPLSIKAQSGQKGLGEGNLLVISSLDAPKELRIKAVEGAFRSKGFTVRNQKREPLEVRVSLEGEAASWSKIKPQSLKIESGKSKRVLLTVNVPDGITKGNYLGRIKLFPALAGENNTQDIEPQEVKVIIEVREF